MVNRNWLCVNRTRALIRRDCTPAMSKPYAVWTGEFPGSTTPTSFPVRITLNKPSAFKTRPLAFETNFRNGLLPMPTCGARLFRGWSLHWTARHFRHGHYTSCAGVHVTMLPFDWRRPTAASRSLHGQDYCPDFPNTKALSQATHRCR